MEHTIEHQDWHSRMWDLGTNVFFTSDQTVTAFKAGKTIGKFSLKDNKEISQEEPAQQTDRKEIDNQI